MTVLLAQLKPRIETGVSFHRARASVAFYFDYEIGEFVRTVQQ